MGYETTGSGWGLRKWLHASPIATSRSGPTCVGGRGDAPVEDWPDNETPPCPLDLAKLDRRLAKLWA